MKPIDLAKVKADFIKLSEIAEHLNELSNQFSEPIALIDDSLNSLRLGVTADISINVDTTLSYGRIVTKEAKTLNRRKTCWGMFITWKKESWAYNQAPRFLRIKCVSAIPSLVEQILKNSIELANELQKKAAEANDWNKRIKEIMK